MEPRIEVMGRKMTIRLLWLATGLLMVLLLAPAQAIAAGCCGAPRAGEGTGRGRGMGAPPRPPIPPTRMLPGQQQIADRLNRRGAGNRQNEPSDISRQTGLTDDQIRQAADHFGMPEDDFRTLLDNVRNPSNSPTSPPTSSVLDYRQLARLVTIYRR